MDDRAGMDLAVGAARTVRRSTSPNPWVGCALVAVDGSVHLGATERPGGRHAERVALDAAGGAARGSTVYVTLEPCSHTGRTEPCADALVEAGVSRVVVATEDPDPLVAGGGITRLRDAGIDVSLGAGETEVVELLAPYLTHRRTGRPYVLLKLAATLDGRTAAPDGSSQWITGEEARADTHRLRAESDAVLVGAGTVRADDPALTVRLVEGPDPERIVLGKAPPGARVHPCREMSGDLADVLDRLGADGILQLLVEGGSTVAAEFHRHGLVDRYVVYLAPALMGGNDGAPLFAGPGAATLDDARRGRILELVRLGDDIRIDLAPEEN